MEKGIKQASKREGLLTASSVPLQATYSTSLEGDAIEAWAQNY